MSAMETYNQDGQ